MSEFAVVISCKMNESDSTNTSFVLDTVDDTSVTSNSVIATHPIVDGDIVADHIYNQPDSLTLTGTFSLNGTKGIVVNQEGAKLEQVQLLFEKIKKEGIICSVVKIHNDENKNIRFKLHKSMVLNHITWIEKANSLDFTFTFTEVLLVNIKKDLLPDQSDKYLPEITDPVTLNFTDTFIDWESITASINNILSSEKLITEDFLYYLSSMTETTLAAIGISLILAAHIMVVLHLSNPIGLVIGAAVGIVYGITKAIINFVRGQKYKIQQFQLYKEEEKNRKEVERYCNFQDELHKNLMQLNNAIKVYNIGSNTSQECSLSIDNNYYWFVFTKDNTTGNYKLEIKDMNESIKKVKLDISSSPTNFSQLHSNNSLYRAAEGGSYIYLICPNEDKTDLTNYYIVVSSMNLDKYNEAVTRIIKNAIMY